MQVSTPFHLYIGAQDTVRGTQGDAASTKEICLRPKLYLSWVEFSLGVDFKALRDTNHSFPSCALLTSSVPATQ